MAAADLEARFYNIIQASCERDKEEINNDDDGGLTGNPTEAEPVKMRGWNTGPVCAMPSEYGTYMTVKASFGP